MKNEKTKQAKGAASPVVVDFQHEKEKRKKEKVRQVILAQAKKLDW